MVPKARRGVYQLSCIKKKERLEDIFDSGTYMSWRKSISVILIICLMSSSYSLTEIPISYLQSVTLANHQNTEKMGFKLCNMQSNWKSQCFDGQVLCPPPQLSADTLSNGSKGCERVGELLQYTWYWWQLSRYVYRLWSYLRNWLDCCSRRAYLFCGSRFYWFQYGAKQSTLESAEYLFL